MKTKPVISFFTLLCVISLMAEACTMPDTPPLVPPTALANPAVTIDMFGPYDGSIYSVGELIYLNGIIKVAFDPSQVSETSFFCITENPSFWLNYTKHLRFLKWTSHGGALANRNQSWLWLGSFAIFSVGESDF